MLSSALAPVLLILLLFQPVFPFLLVFFVFAVFDGFQLDTVGFNLSFVQILKNSSIFLCYLVPVYLYTKILWYDWDTSDQTLERVLDVRARLRTHFQEPEVATPRPLHGHVVRHFPIGQVAFITEQHYDNSSVYVIAHLLEPTVKLLETLPAGAVIHQKCSDRLPEKQWR